MAKAVTLLGFSAIVFASCAIRSPPSPPEIPPGHHFSYWAPLRESLGLVQAFDDGSMTYLQFQGSPPESLTVRSVPDDTLLAVRMDGSFAKLTGVYREIRVSVAGRTISVTNEGAVRATALFANSSLDAKPSDQEIPPMDATRSTLPITENEGGSRRMEKAAAIPRVGVPETLQTMHTNGRVAIRTPEIASLEDRVSALKTALEEAHTRGEGANVFLREVGQTSRVVVTFDDENSEPKVAAGLADILGEAARAANRVYLHGHTDAFVSSDRGASLAVNRAVEVRALLIARHVEPSRIRLFYQGAGNFLANNSTAEGRALNRRVEIELRKW